MERDPEPIGPNAAPEAGDSPPPVVFRRTVLSPGQGVFSALSEQTPTGPPGSLGIAGPAEARPAQTGTDQFAAVLPADTAPSAADDQSFPAAAPHFAGAAPALPLLSDTRQFATMSVDASMPGPPGNHGNDAGGGDGPGRRRPWLLVAVSTAVVLAAVAAIPLAHQLRSGTATTNQIGHVSGLSASTAAVPAMSAKASAGIATTSSAPSAASGAAAPSSAAGKHTKQAGQGAAGTKPAAPIVSPTSTGPAPLLDIYTGRGCAQTSTYGFYTHAESSSDWTVGTSGGYVGNSCTGRYDSFSLFNTTAWADRYLEWWIENPSLGNATCNVWVYIPKASSAADTAGSGTFAVIPAKLSMDTLGRFTVDEAAKRGGWTFGGSYVMTSGNLAVKLLGIGTGRAAGSAVHVQCWS